MMVKKKWLKSVSRNQKVKVKEHTLDIVPLHSESPPQKCKDIAKIKVARFLCDTI